ncbi:MAG: hypothetical protein MAGBODY4_00264 [Candidatus Marinimicrobia bacterium]|nr:hypothetical protein [Candidatus Neomarinimicrobiota bacterium]
MLEPILTFLVFVGTLSFIASPLVRRAGYFRKVNEDTTLRNLEQEKFNIYAQIKEADFEYEMGKLSYRDYQLQRQELLEKAEQVLGEIEYYQNGELAKDAEEKPAETAIAEDAGSVCPNCNADVQESAKYCSHCGQEIASTPDNSCANCGNVNPEGSSFCAHCGEGLAAA